jgi:hypothetical protein
MSDGLQQPRRVAIALRWRLLLLDVRSAGRRALSGRLLSRHPGRRRVGSPRVTALWTAFAVILTLWLLWSLLRAVFVYVGGAIGIAH